MKKIVISLILSLAVVFGCSKKADVVSLKVGTPAYDLAASVAEKVSFLSPDSNNVLIETDNFSLTTGEIFKTLQDGLGERAKQLSQFPEARIKAIIKQNAQQLAEKKLLADAAKKAGISASADEVNAKLEENAKNFGGMEKYEEFIKKNNLSMDFVNNEVHTALNIQKYLDQAFENAGGISEEDIKAEYGKDISASVRHILFMTRGKSEAEKAEIRKKAEEVLAMAKKGKDFAKLAKKYSEDPGSKDKGGLYENFGRGKMVKPFEDAAFNLPVGSISDLVETQYGFHIVKVVDRKKETKPLEEVREQIENRLKQTRHRDSDTAEVNRLKEAAHYTETEW